MIGLTYRVTMVAFDRAQLTHPELIGHTCINTWLRWDRGQAHVTIEWCKGEIEYQLTEQMVEAVRRMQ